MAFPPSSKYPMEFDGLVISTFIGQDLRVFVSAAPILLTERVHQEQRVGGSGRFSYVLLCCFVGWYCRYSSCGDGDKVGDEEREWGVMRNKGKAGCG